MTTIGAAWVKFTESGKTYISIKIDNELLPFVLRENKNLTLWEISDEERKGNDKMPHYRLKITNPMQKQ